MAGRLTLHRPPGGRAEPRLDELLIATYNVGILAPTWNGRNGPQTMVKLTEDLRRLADRGAHVILLQELGNHDRLLDGFEEALVSLAPSGWIYKVDGVYAVLADPGVVASLSHAVEEQLAPAPMRHVAGQLFQAPATGQEWRRYQHGVLTLADPAGTRVGFVNLHIVCGSRTRRTNYSTRSQILRRALDRLPSAPDAPKHWVVAGDANLAEFEWNLVLSGTGYEDSRYAAA